MNKNLIILTDYKGFFGSKQKSKIYRGGFDLSKLEQLFKESGFKVTIMQFVELNFRYAEVIKQNPVVLYQSSEDKNDFYKSFVEDIIYDLEQQGLKVIPKYAYLKAHNNKVAMELLRKRANIPEIKTIVSKYFGAREEALLVADRIHYPVVIKPASGAMSRGVGLVFNKKQLKRFTKKISVTKYFWHDIKELLRKVKYAHQYNRESFYRQKFITQNFISRLDNDWKVLVYGSKCFVLYRGVRKGDFRASGSGNFEFRKNIPEGMLDFAFKVKEKFNVPHISLDIAFDGKEFHLIEFQFVMFGTTTLEKSDFYFQHSDTSWNLIREKADLEKIYVESIKEFIS